jgi:hypothetical protein
MREFDVLCEVCRLRCNMELRNQRKRKEKVAGSRPFARTTTRSRERYPTSEDRLFWFVRTTPRSRERCTKRQDRNFWFVRTPPRSRERPVEAWTEPFGSRERLTVRTNGPGRDLAFARTLSRSRERPDVLGYLRACFIEGLLVGSRPLQTLLHLSSPLRAILSLSTPWCTVFRVSLSLLLALHILFIHDIVLNW